MATNTVIADIEPEGRELSESELAAIVGGVQPPTKVPPPTTGGPCNICH